MAYVWTWLGAANLAASALLLTLAALFLRARRSEFTAAFAAYCVATSAQKVSGGMWLYLAADDATRAQWRLAVFVLYLVVIPLLAHAMAAFVWGKRFSMLRAKRFALYAPSFALVPVLVLDRARFESLSLALALVFTFLLIPFLVLVARKRRWAATEVERTQSLYMLVYLIIVVAFTAEARALPFLIGRTPWWELSIAYTVATTILLYGILKTHLFDIDVKLKWTIQRGTLAAAFVAVFLVVAQLAQNFLSNQYGWAFGGIAAGLLLFAFQPLQRLAERVANAAMPGVRPLHEMAHPDRAGLYREQAAIAWADGILTADERRMLDAARTRLGLSTEEASTIEAEAIHAAQPHRAALARGLMSAPRLRRGVRALVVALVILVVLPSAFALGSTARYAGRGGAYSCVLPGSVGVGGACALVPQNADVYRVRVVDDLLGEGVRVQVLVDNNEVRHGCVSSLPAFLRGSIVTIRVDLASEDPGCPYAAGASAGTLIVG